MRDVGCWRVLELTLAATATTFVVVELICCLVLYHSNSTSTHKGFVLFWLKANGADNNVMRFGLENELKRTVSRAKNQRAGA